MPGAKKIEKSEPVVEDQVERLIQALQSLDASMRAHGDEMQLHRAQMEQLANTERMIYHLIHEILDGLDQAPRKIAGAFIHRILGDESPKR